MRDVHVRPEVPYLISRTVEDSWMTRGRRGGIILLASPLYDIGWVSTPSRNAGRSFAATPIPHTWYDIALPCGE